MGSSYPALRRSLLNPLAEDIGSTYDLAMLAHDPTHAQRAVRLVGCGCDLLSQFIYKEPGYFPSPDRRTRRKGARLMTQNFPEENARLAAVFLAQSLGWLLHESFACAGETDTSNLQLALIKLVQDHYPLSDEPLAALQHGRAEYRTLDQHALRREVVIGAESATGYHRALQDPNWLDGAKPDDDPDLVEAQERYASQFLRCSAEMFAIETTIGTHSFAALETKMFKLGSPEYEANVQDLASSSWWADVADDWQSIAQGSNAQGTGS